MEYSNPKIPEGINTGKEHPLKEFAILFAGIVGLVVIVVAVLSLTAEKLAPYIPFEMEERLVEQHKDLFPDDNEITSYLQGLADNLTASMKMPGNMRITVHYSDDSTINAYATLGGHIIIYRGLLEQMPHENALAMVLAHEIAHIYHRHPIIATGRGLIVAMALASFAGLSGNELFLGAISDASMMTMMSFSRAQEREADKTGINAVATLYGHVAGADDLFRALIKLPHSRLISAPAFMRSHPLSQDRIDDLSRYADFNGWARDKPTKPLPDFVVSSLSSDENDASKKTNP